MFSFLSEFTRDLDTAYTIIVMDEEGMEQPRPYRIHPRRVLMGGLGVIVGISVVLVSLIVLTPLRELIPGYGTAEIRRDARVNAIRLAAMEDSLRTQQAYMDQLRRLMLGQFDSTFTRTERPPAPAVTVSGALASDAPETVTENWNDHQQPALSVSHTPPLTDAPLRLTEASARYLSSLRLPALPPVNGYPTRGFDARTGHFALDIAVEAGTVVRAIGDGYVIFADYAHDGGYTLTIQHADGYVSVYKHNQRLLKRVGDRVRDREAVATSGNSGEVTSGPHLHFELWYHGLAQDPRLFLIGL